jgi:hypothetical protein
MRQLRADGVKIVEPISQKGGNSSLHIFKLNGKSYVLKVYKGEPRRIRNSKLREEAAYKFLIDRGFNKLPRWQSSFDLEDGICLEFIRGQTPKSNSRTLVTILECINELDAIYSRDASFENAVDSAFSTDDLLRQIEKRFCALQEEFTEGLGWLQSTIEVLKERRAVEFPKWTITYSLSDIGSHNMIKRFNRYKFFDLEFFGKDSAVKMLLDFLLHPRNQFSPRNRVRFLKQVTETFDMHLETTLEVTPFIAAKWATIVFRRMSFDYGQGNELALKKNLARYLDIANMRSNEEIAKKLVS